MGPLDDNRQMTNSESAKAKQDVFKAAMRRWTSGVTVVTAKDETRMHGMTVSAFTSVSVDPPTVLVCANKSSLTQDVIEAGRVFCVNVLAADQGEVCMRFAQADTDRFENVKWHLGDTGAPRIEGAIAHFDCRVVQAFEVATHVIYIGEVETTVVGKGAPLVYVDGAFQTLRPA